jgi:hypothetical protein
MLVALLAAGCGAQRASTQQITVQGCADYGVYAIDHHITVTRTPAACRGLGKAQLNEAAANAINTVVGGRSHKAAWLKLTAEVAPRLAYLITAPQPVPSSPPQAYQPAGGTQLRESTGSDVARGLAALGAWLVTASSGAHMLGSRITGSGTRRQRTPATGTPPGVLLGHFGLATAGLMIWVIYLIIGWPALAWTAVGLLLPVAGLGIAMVTLGLPGSQAGAVHVGLAATPARGRVPILLVAGHGLLAATTVLLILVAAIGTGGG